MKSIHNKRQWGYRRHDPVEKCQAVGKICSGCRRETILNMYVNQILYLNQEEVNIVHTEESQLCMENAEGRSQQNVVERDTLLESKEDDDTNQESIFFIGDD